MFRKFMLYSLLFLLPVVALTQSSGHGPFSKKTERLFKKAKKYKLKGADEKAIKTFEKIIHKEPGHIESRLQLSGLYYRRGAYVKAEKQLITSLTIDSLYDPEIYFSLGLIQENMNKREEAVYHYQKYLALDISNQKKKELAWEKTGRLEFIIEAMKHPVPFEPILLGPSINTDAPEYLANVSVSGELMVFSRRINRQEDLYYSELKDGNWKGAIALKDLNTGGNEAAHCLSSDGKTILFTACDREDGMGSCDLYLSRMENGSWSDPVNMGYPVNSENWDSQPSLSSDGKTLYFSSNRPGGVGGRDIWITYQSKNGEWSQPVNAGEKINTKLGEESPFIHPNNSTLYFMSKGHLGMGGYDLFVAHKIGEIWTRALNLGYPINSEKDEGALRVASDGRTAYYSTITDENQSLDIISFQLHDKIRTLPVSYLKGKVVDKESQKPLKVAIDLGNNESSERIERILSEPDGTFLITLPLGFDYNFSVSHPGYVYFSENFVYENKAEEAESNELLIELLPVKEDQTESKEVPNVPIALKNIFFETASAVLKEENSRIELQNLISFLTDNPGIRIRIQGHTDAIGTDMDNMILSLDRANAVFQYLVDGGIAAERLEVKGFGESQPIAGNESEKNRKLNRRTEFVITKW